MSNEITNYARTALTKSDRKISHDVGMGLVEIGGGGMVLALAAGMLPFITLPMLLVAAVLFGGYLLVK